MDFEATPVPLACLIHVSNPIACIDADNSHTCNGSETLWVYDAYGKPDP